MAKLNVYLNFPGTTEKAFAFYRSIFGGEYSNIQRFKETPEAGQIPANEQNLLMHVALPIGDGDVLMGTDARESIGQKLTAGDNFHLSFEADSKADAARVHAALAKGGKVTMPLADTFWGAYFGMVTDPFNIRWMVSFTERKPR